MTEQLEVCSECHLTSKMHPDMKCLYKDTYYEPIRCRGCRTPIRFNVYAANSYGPGDPVDLSVNPLYCGRCTG